VSRGKKSGVVVDVFDAGRGPGAADLAAALGLQRVGVAFATPPRDPEQVFTAAELQHLCEQAAATRDAGGAFLGLRYRAVMDGEDLPGLVTAEAYEPTQQCEELAATGLIGGDTAEGTIALVPEKQLIIENRPAAGGDSAFFVSRIHDCSGPHTSPLRSAFPQGSGGLRKLHVRKWLQKEEASVPWPELAADWGFLLHVAGILPPPDYRALLEVVSWRVRGMKLTAQQETTTRAVCARCRELLYAYMGGGKWPNPATSLDEIP
jgi:hypothetical protein